MSDHCKPWLCVFGSMGLTLFDGKGRAQIFKLRILLSAEFWIFHESLFSKYECKPMRITDQDGVAASMANACRYCQLLQQQAKPFPPVQRKGEMCKPLDFSTWETDYIAFWHYLRCYSEYGWLFNV